MYYVAYRADGSLQAGAASRSAGSQGWVAAGLLQLLGNPARILAEEISGCTISPMDLPIYPTCIIDGLLSVRFYFSYQASSSGRDKSLAIEVLHSEEPESKQINPM